MKVKNKKTGEIEFLRHGPATDAVTAGTHEFVSDEAEVDGQDDAKAEKAKPAKAEQEAKK